MLDTVREACRRTAAKMDPDRVPILAGWCVEVSLLAQQAFGGIVLHGQYNGEDHFWNQLPDGREVDLTSDQFGGDGFAPVISGAYFVNPELAPIKSLAFATLVLHELGSSLATL